MREIPELFETHPVVFAVKDTYHIMVPVKAPALMWVTVGEENYYDASNGILRSEVMFHRMIVPMETLDEHRSYTVVYRKILNRKPYFPETEEEVSTTYAFKPVEGEDIHIYHLSDTHNKVTTPVLCGQYFKEHLDLLILNGDIPNHSGEIKNFKTIYEIAGAITEGSIPVVFSRGNHDTRGIYAESIAEYTPTDHGNSYYTFRLGHLWGIVLDCGEDKADTHPEYGHTISCHAFRKAETAFMKQVVKNSCEEYEGEGVKHRLVVVHIPFTDTMKPPFDIEQDLYREWAQILRDEIKPDLMVSGHLHTIRVDLPGSEHDKKGQACPVVIGSKPFLKQEPDYFIGTAITLSDHVMKIDFTDSLGEIVESHELPKRNQRGE